MFEKTNLLFYSLQEEERAAFCDLPPETGPCRAAIRSVIFNQTTKLLAFAVKNNSGKHCQFTIKDAGEPDEKVCSHRLCQTATQ
jgi:hypothetical protein